MSDLDPAQFSVASGRKPPELDEKHAFDQIFSLAYEELRRIASSVRRCEFHETLSTTALVHETWLKLKDSPKLASTSLPHFKAIAVRAMRQVLVEEARRRNALKRNSELVSFSDANSIQQSSLSWSDILTVDALLQELAKASPRQAAIAERRFFGGETVAEAAQALGVSESVVERDWRAAKAWLGSKLRISKEPC